MLELPLDIFRAVISQQHHHSRGSQHRYKIKREEGGSSNRDPMLDVVEKLFQR